MSTTVTAKGQVTIPKAVRELLGLRPGTQVDFRQTPDGNVIMVPAQGKVRSDRFGSLRGHAGVGLTTDEIMALTRGDD
ncbi:AbrB/MazE/SpoVT family DNA-binding domain-containing protein [Rhizobium tumorigenes]|uniref:AbrB/MazE/SpoVT family DNA-binding domain-containing protein n=1 Tax=Rhizobium tumorigenes TaxID=2041385 RepID=UPI00241F746D|nr:AbrB/MazE/SpoVT family DNA-binding domain-containing protein [Rhizobium tumorigenes]WFS04776.1 AbrB/MazE/SpoVT family DNA-binding domain-containing protein [Rhizobium tumorigenes]